MQVANLENAAERDNEKNVQGELFQRPLLRDLFLISSMNEIAVVCRGLCIFVFGRSDKFSRNFCIVQLHLAARIDLKSLSTLFHLSYQQCSRILSLYKKNGVDGLREETSIRFSNRRVIDDEVGRFIELEREKGRMFSEISELIRFQFKKKIKEKSIRVWMKKKQEAEANARGATQLEMLELLNDNTLIGSALDSEKWEQNSYAGAMILYSMIERSGFLRSFSEYILEDTEKRDSSSGVRRVMLTLFFLHALRCKSIEQSKHLLGKDFSVLVGGPFLRLQPLREAVDKIVPNQGFDQAIDAYYKDLIAMTDRGDRVLFTDGHFSSYFGHRNIPKGFDPRRQMGFRGRNTIYLHNSVGENVYLFESPTNTSLSRDIESLVEDLIKLKMKVKRRTLFFDRGGYSQACFRYLNKHRMYFVTYLKNRKKERLIKESEFKSQKIKTEEGEEFEYLIYEKERRWTKFGRVRIIVFLSTEGRQIPIITSNPFMSPVKLIYTLSRRWREENCFKFMIEHFGIDLLCTYKTEVAPNKIIKRPNWERREILKEIQKKKGELTKLKSDLAEKVILNNENPSQTINEFLTEQSKLKSEINNIQVDIDILEKKKNSYPTQIEINLSDDHVIISQKRRLFINAIKAMNYNAEKWLQEILKECGYKSDETLSLIRSLFRQPGKIRSSGRVVEVELKALEIKSMKQSLDKVIEKLNKNRHLRLPDGRTLRIMQA